MKTKVVHHDAFYFNFVKQFDVPICHNVLVLFRVLVWCNIWQIGFGLCGETSQLYYSGADAILEKAKLGA